ncbi:hypothetical protein PEC311524_04340 [Pectobacterium carotovorum subsp. carotovorum]|nr:hypothetical protein PEC311524_04340 [Pectobacterium carotovorum subsp. carotovorum]
MNGIGNISLFTMLQRAGSQYFNANVSRSFNLSQVISSNQSGIGVKVSLSDESIYKNLLTSIQTNTVESIDGMNKKGIKEIWEIVANGKGNAEADYLKDSPKSDDEARLALAKQAADYVVSGESGRNPFEGVERKTLSAIAYDESGSFTTSERYAAYLQLGKQDNSFENAVYSATSMGLDGDDIVALKSKLILISGMSDAEKSAKGITQNIIDLNEFELTEMESKAGKIYQGLNYDNLKPDIAYDLLAAVKNADGNFSWQSQSSLTLFFAIKSNDEIPAINSMIYIAE